MMQTIFALLISLLLVSPVSCQTCHWPDGSIATSYQRCNDTTAQCCYNSDPTHRDICFDNGLCMSMLWGGMYRGACSDPYWNPGSGCAEQCTDVKRDGFSPVTACGTKMCCGAVDESVVSCCNSTDAGGFQWANSTVGNLGICPAPETGLSKSDIIAIVTGTVAAFLALVAWIWPQNSTSLMGRARERLRDLVFKKKKVQHVNQDGGLHVADGPDAVDSLYEVGFGPESPATSGQDIMSPSGQSATSSRSTEALLGPYQGYHSNLASP
ncbi:hypothetical protein QBC37DRAFT_434947 [Rhypophila decipiens]|uniref:Uncharacterized protein n=1 Tax=Rhypophila decipiens TaxID=261697 RepID=A0AAN6XVR4_9PEZI|nr:hypothetical protein QBC37DRAFT_434947 [Rhypophila decipiens]